MKIKKANDPYGVARIKTRHSALGLLMAECEQLRRDLAQAKAENARLAAVCALAYEKLSWIREHVEFKDSMNVAIIELGKAADSTVLRDLLAPTIEILRQATLRPITWQDDVKSELARLRAITKQ